VLTFEQFLGFLLAAMFITVSPGPDNLMVLSMGVSKGRKQGIAFGLGCALGCLSHTLLAVAGISALIAASPAAFTVLKLGGGSIFYGWALTCYTTRTLSNWEEQGSPIPLYQRYFSKV
jgi:threonine/homoserine/homoserine lactone efflux protein